LHRHLFVRLFVGLCKNAQPIFTEFGEKVAHGPWKKPLDFGWMTSELR